MPGLHNNNSQNATYIGGGEIVEVDGGFKIFLGDNPGSGERVVFVGFLSIGTLTKFVAAAQDHLAAASAKRPDPAPSPVAGTSDPALAPAAPTAAEPGPAAPVTETATGETAAKVEALAKAAPLSQLEAAAASEEEEMLANTQAIATRERESRLARLNATAHNENADK